MSPLDFYPIRIQLGLSVRSLIAGAKSETEWNLFHFPFSVFQICILELYKCPKPFWISGFRLEYFSHFQTAWYFKHPDILNCPIFPFSTNSVHHQIDWAVNETKWAATWQNHQNYGAPGEDSDQPGNPPSLIRVFAVRMKKARVLTYLLSAQRRFWSDWAHTQFVGFVMSWLERERERERAFVRACVRAYMHAFSGLKARFIINTISPNLHPPPRQLPYAHPFPKLKDEEKEKKQKQRERNKTVSSV